MKVKCWICNSSTIQRTVRLRDDSQNKINACQDCGFEFFNLENMEAIKNNQFEDLRLASAGLKIPDINQDFNNGYNQSEEYIKRYIDSDSKEIEVLEIGCSWGYFLARLKEKNINCIGLEKNPVRQKFVQNKTGFKCYNDLIKVEEKNMNFDKIFMFYTLEYISNPLDYIKRLLKLLKPNGELIIYTPNLSDILKDSWNNEAFNKFFYEKQTIGYYTLESMRRLVKKVKNNKISYQLSTEQGYSFYNHLSWYLTNKPKSTGIVGGDNFTNEILSTFKQNTDIEQALKALILNFDNEYKKIVEKSKAGNRIILIMKNKGKEN